MEDSKKDVLRQRGQALRKAGLTAEAALDRAHQLLHMSDAGFALVVEDVEKCHTQQAKLVTKAATELDRASYFTAFGLTQAAAEAYVERLALLSDSAFLSVVDSVDAQINVQKAQKYIDMTTDILKAKYHR
jgi:hypothetical protein